MRTTRINGAYLREEITRDCCYFHYVEFLEKEIGMEGDAIVGFVPDDNKWVCLAINGKLAWSEGSPAIKSAIKNAYLL